MNSLRRHNNSLRAAPVEVIVAVPACNESATIGECIQSIDRAAERTGIRTRIVLAADSCDDNTVAAAITQPLKRSRLTAIEGLWRCAGAARDAAVAHGLQSSTRSLETLWIANTDADCRVPGEWLERQLRLARRFDALAGIVDLDPRTTPKHILAGFRATYEIDGDTHPHVHGANFGVRASAYVRTGGWNSTTAVGEDHELWNSLIADGAPVRQDAHLRVVTSARTISRVEGGFATNLRMIEPQPALVSASP
jgi:glycosyltransferase involved in cell wall biosynthesis